MKAHQGDRIILAARVEDGVEVGTGDERYVAGQDQDLGRVGGDDDEGCGDRIPGPARFVLQGEHGALREDVDHRRDRGREDDDRAATA